MTLAVRWSAAVEIVTKDGFINRCGASEKGGEIFHLFSPGDFRAFERKEADSYMIYDLQVFLRECLEQRHEVAYGYDNQVVIRWKRDRSVDPLVGLVRVLSYNHGLIPAVMFNRTLNHNADAAPAYSDFYNARFGVPQELKKCEMIGCVKGNFEASEASDDIAEKIKDAERNLNRTYDPKCSHDSDTLWWLCKCGMVNPAGSTRCWNAPCKWRPLYRATIMHQKPDRTQVMVKLVFQVEIGEQPGHFVPFPRAVLWDDVMPVFSTTWSIYNQPKRGPSELYREAAATFVLIQSAGIAAATKYTLRRMAAHNKEFLAMKAIAYHPAHQILALAASLCMWVMPFWEMDEYAEQVHRVLYAGYEWILPIRTEHGASYDEIINEGFEEFVVRMAGHFKNCPDQQFGDFYDAESMYDLSDPTSMPWKLLRSIFRQLKERTYYNCWTSGDGVFPEKDEVLEKDWDNLNSLVVSIVDETLEQMTLEQIPRDQRLNIVAWFGRNPMSNVPPNKAVAPKEVQVVQPITMAVRALASTISVRYDPMFREMAQQGSADGASRPLSIGDGIPRTPPRRPPPSSAPGLAVAEQSLPTVKEEEAPVSPTAVDWNWEATLSDAQLGDDAYLQKPPNVAQHWPGDNSRIAVELRAAALAEYWIEMKIGPKDL